jgi:hypothetical protein
MQALRQLRALPWWLYQRLRGTLGRVSEVPAAAPSPWAVSKLPHGSLFSTLEDHALGRARPPIQYRMSAAHPLLRSVRLSKITGTSPTATSARDGNAASPSRSSRASW